MNICNNRLTRFRLASLLPQMTSLVLSGNELSIAEDFSNLVISIIGVTSHYCNLPFFQPSLESLDLSFNKLACLQGMKVLIAVYYTTGVIIVTNFAVSFEAEVLRCQLELSDQLS